MAIEFNPDTTIPWEAVVATSADALVRKGEVAAALLLAHGDIRVGFDSHDDWNGGQDTWMVKIMIDGETLDDLQNRKLAEDTISGALNNSLSAVSDADFARAQLVPRLINIEGWRDKISAAALGTHINNQARVRSEAIPILSRDGLRFRSRAEVNFYQAHESLGITFAPLPVVLRGGVTYQRTEPDFVLFLNGRTVVVEIDGDSFHRENPATAHERLRLMHDNGVIIERVNADQCASMNIAVEVAEALIKRVQAMNRS